MATQVETASEAKEQLWDRLEDGRISMLGVRNSSQHLQPMTHFVDREAGVIWYITSADTDLAQTIEGRTPSELIFMAKGQDYQASLSGHLEIVFDDAKLDEIWSIAAAAWFEKGRDDPNVRLLRFTPGEAAIWASQSSSILVGLKMLRAGMQEGAAEPDVGVHRIIEFNRAA